MKLNMSQKALLVVVVPLAMQLAFLFAVNSLLDQSERDVKVQAHARAVSLALNDLFRLVLNSAAGITAYGYTHNKHFVKRYESASDAVPDKLAVLNDLTKEDPEENKIIQDLSTAITDGMASFSKMHYQVFKKDYFAALKTMHTMKPVVAAVYEEFDAAAEMVSSLENRSPLTEQRTRSFLRRVLWASAFASVLLAIGITVAISRSTTSRLKLLVENTNRFASGKDLLPPTGGHDEIAHLDAVFRDMVRTVDDAQRLKEQFVSVISHELRTPLMNVQGILELLQAGVYGELHQDGTEQVKSAAHSTDRLMNLINDLLSIDKLQSGMLEIIPRNINIKEVLARSVDIVGNISSRKNIVVAITGDDNIELEADPDRLTQVVTNFLSNAIKYSEAGTAIQVSLKRDGDTVRVAVKDSGRGIPADLLEKVFDRYVQVEKADSNIGTGLGLAICKAIIDQHGGKIGVISEPGAGSEFWFELPAARSVVTVGHDSVTNSA